jgi:hypothetical protein
VTPDTLAPVFFLAAGLSILAGTVKVTRPDPAAQAMLDAGLPGTPVWARTVGVVEISVGVWAWVRPAAGGAVALGVLYLVFAGYLGYLLVAKPEAGSCGCAGPTPVPPSRLHLTIDLIAAGASFGYAAVDGPSLIAWIDGLGWAAVPVAFGLVLAGWLAVIAVTEAPSAFRAWEAAPHDHTVAPHGHDHVVTDDALANAGIAAGHTSLWPNTKPDDG